MNLRQLGFFLLSVAVVVLSVCFLISIYHSTQSVTATEIKSLEESLQKVVETLKVNNDPSGMLSKFSSETDRLQASLRILNQSANSDSELRQKTEDDLNSVILTLASIQRQWRNENHTNYAALSETGFKLKTIRERLEPTTGLAKVVGTVITQVTGLLAGLGKLIVLVAWPLVGLMFLWYLFSSKTGPQRITELVSNFKTLEVGGFKLERAAEKVRVNLEETFALYRAEVKQFYDASVATRSLDKRLNTLVAAESDIIKEINKARNMIKADAAAIQDYRCTIHVPDLLFADTFYQLLDYSPTQPDPQPKPVTRGRTWSYRFGFIGRIWRTEKSDVACASTNIDDLIDRWGMTRDEAADAGKDRKSFIGILIKEGNLSVGLFYMDSKEEDAFGPTTNATALCNAILGILNDAKITEDLASIRRDLSGKAPKISIYSQR